MSKPATNGLFLGRTRRSTATGNVIALAMISALLAALLVAPGAHALTGAADSAVKALETVSPTLDSASATTESSLSITFSEPMLLPGVTTGLNYSVSGAGAGTLSAHPTGASGSGPYSLSWSTGEMENGALITVKAAGLQDLVGNPISATRNSASTTGLGSVPQFSALEVSPSQAAAGVSVTITFTSSETLNGEPAVTVNGHDASFVSGGPSYTYTYTVRGDDPIGMASISITGVDEANNTGSLSDETALQITEPVPVLPLHAWPAGLAILIAAAAMCRRHRWAGSLLVLVALLASSSALAATPTVSNVNYNQRANGTTGTRVHIYYDLVAPNGPCTITPTLSKDGGTDGFPYPITSCTGDLTNVATGNGHHIIWDIRADYPEENIPQARIRITADDGIVQHTLTYTSGANGSISGASPQIVNDGGSGSMVAAVANTGYHFVQWSDGVLTASRTDSNVTANISVTASFAINTFTLTYTAGAHGSITGASPQTVNYGASGTAVTATPETGYHFVQWSDGVLTASRTDSNVTANVSVTASFAINTFTLTYIAGTHGSISGTSPQTVNYGASGTAITAVPETGYHFVQWSDGSTQNPRTDANVTATISVTAGFAINTYSLTYTAGTHGTISGTSPQTVNYGASGTAVTATPETGYHFVQWSDGVLTASRTETNVTANISVTASFAINTFTLTYTAGAHGSITGTSPQTVNYGASGTAVNAVPETGYHFVQWSDGVLTASRTDSNVTANISVSASFALNIYTLTYTAGSHGSITGTSPQTVSHGGSGTTVTAVPDTGYHFVQWSDGVLTAARTDTNVTANISVTATFAINTFTLTYSAGTHGSISGTSPQTVNYGASGTTVTAVADSGYHFVQWSDNVLTAARTDANVTANLSVTASFALSPPVVTSFAISNGAATSSSPSVTLNNTCTGGPVDYMASESSSFTGALWSAYAAAPAFTLSGVLGGRTVYFKTRNAAGESNVMSDSIFLPPVTLSVASGAFTMGRSASGDDMIFGAANEDPRHSVTLGAYQIAKNETTNQQYCDALNWASSQGYLYSDAAGTAWSGSGDIYAGTADGARYVILTFSSADCPIQYGSGTFSPKTLTGLPGSTAYSMAGHPIVTVTWFGAVAFCNWLSQWQGLTPCYDMGTAAWPLTVAPPASGGYRLPTEAEWERAAAWDGSKHWIYGFTGDTLADDSHANYYNGTDYVNPLGLTAFPYTSPDGWFNGVNVSPNGTVTTVNSASPVGAYDMCGNVWEWCQDWYLPSYYSGGAMTNPTGPASGTDRSLRGGSWTDYFVYCRTATRYYSTPDSTYRDIGFRFARTP